MTTIATDGKTMAADGLVTGNGIIHDFDAVKIVRLPDGRIAGFAGNLYDIPIAVEWLSKGGDVPKLSAEFEALVIGPDGCVSINSDGVACPQAVPAVTGSGGALALGAMLACADPHRAVGIACERDMKSGGSITVLSL